MPVVSTEKPFGPNAPAVRTKPAFRRGGHRFQDVFVNGVALHKEVKEGRTFQNLGDYLIKYHGYRHFDLVAGSGKHIGTEWWIRIRLKGLLERLLRPSLDGRIWEDGKAVAAHQRPISTT